MKRKIRTIAFYLPQFHPTEENNTWWGKGFTEWTNVAKAKRFFPGHYQPRIPADLGFYDLRIPEVREKQAQLAQEAGLEGFCYWHYWFNGRRLLDLPFKEVLNSGTPDFPFCLCWANHSWYAKTWNNDGKDKLLIEQTYPGDEDYIRHFYALLPAFKDTRYIRIRKKPLFGVYAAKDLPDPAHFIALWNELACKEGLEGIHFTAIGFTPSDASRLLKQGFNSVLYDTMFKKELSRYFSVLMHKVFRLPILIDYRYYTRLVLENIKVSPRLFPCIIPNFDHTPRSGRRGNVMYNSTPGKWRLLLDRLFLLLADKDPEENVVFIKSWNEWGEGNYLEPDLKFGNAYLEELRAALDKAAGEMDR